MKQPIRMDRIMKEFKQGFSFLSKLKKGVSFFGSRKPKPNEPFYNEARELARRVAASGYTVITGGGPGIMEAANRGAHDAGGESIGLGIEISAEKGQNKFVKKGLSFYYFFTRKVMLSASAQVYVFFPGGFGTFDEFFELVTLIQTKKTRPIPVILFGSKFWLPLYNYLYKDMYKKWGYIDKKDLSSLHIVDDISEAEKIILKSKIRNSLS